METKPSTRTVPGRPQAHYRSVAPEEHSSWAPAGVSHGGGRGRAGWLLVGGLALALVGLVTQPGAAGPAAQSTGGIGGNQQQTSSTPSLGSGYGTADSNGSMIAVTGIDVTGGSLLYVIDSESKQLAVYQAQGGTSSTMNLKFVGGRRIDLDLQVYGYNDESDYSYDELQREFESNGTASNPSKKN